jgi:hypothetical protein
MGMDGGSTLEPSRTLFRPPPPIPEEFRAEELADVFPVEAIPVPVTVDMLGAQIHDTRPPPWIPEGPRAEAPLAEVFPIKAIASEPVAIDKPTGPAHNTTDRPEKTLHERYPRDSVAPSSPPATPGQDRLAAVSARVMPEAKKRLSLPATRPSLEPSLAPLPPAAGSAVELRSEPVRHQSQSLSPAPTPKAPAPPVSTKETAAVVRPLPAALPARMNAIRNTAGHPAPTAEPASQHASEEPRIVLTPLPPIRRDSSARVPGSAQKGDGVHRHSGATVRIGSLEVRILPLPATAPLTATSFPRHSPALRPASVLSQGFRSFGLTQG